MTELQIQKEKAFKKDLNFEHIITKWLNTKTKLFDILSVKTINNDLVLQKQGVDIICNNANGRDILIDIKSIAQNKGFHTFSFELAGVFDTKQPGWLLNDKIITDYYLLTYHDIEGGCGKYSYDKTIATENNIGNSDILLIDKERVKELIINYFKENYHVEQLELDTICQKIRQKYIDLGKPKEVLRFGLNANGELCDLPKGCKIRFTISGTLPECPINVVIEKTLLEEISEEKFSNIPKLGYSLI